MEVIKKPDFSFGFGQKSPRDTGHMCQCSLWGQLRDGEERWEDGAEALPGGGRTESGRDLFLARRVGTQAPTYTSNLWKQTFCTLCADITEGCRRSTLRSCPQAQGLWTPV